MNDTAVDSFTLSMLTNRELLDLNADAGNNATCVTNCNDYPTGVVGWRAIATSGPYSGVKYVAILNAETRDVTTAIALG